MAGVAGLFTREFFTAVRDRLAPDGIICQWAHTYDISERDLRSVVRTFAAVFPQGTMWLVGDGDLLLIGTNGVSIEDHLAALATDWRQASTSTLIWLMSRCAIPCAAVVDVCRRTCRARRACGDTAAIQDRRSYALEFSGPRAVNGVAAATNTATLRRFSKDAGRRRRSRGSAQRRQPRSGATVAR
jgi:spermidine synthase